jgi:hypothetical protein
LRQVLFHFFATARRFAVLIYGSDDANARRTFVTLHCWAGRNLGAAFVAFRRLQKMVGFGGASAAGKGS